VLGVIRAGGIMRARRRQPEPEACCPAHRPHRPAFASDETAGNLNNTMSADGRKAFDELCREGKLGQFARRKETISDAGRGSLWAAWWRKRPSSILACLLLAMFSIPAGESQRLCTATMLRYVWLTYVCCYGAAHCQDGRGTFRYGEIYWHSVGNSVYFTIDVIFKRKQDSDWSFRGTAPDGMAAIGDRMLVAARDAPQFFYGDSQIERVMHMEVTSMSVKDDWVRGIITLPPHSYQQPNNGGKPWAAQFTGCCRFTDLKNNAGTAWAIVADIDLTKATRSPRASILPLITVPYHPVSHPKPTFYLAVDEPELIQFALGKPAMVGGAVHLTRAKKSVLSVPLQPLRNTATAGNCTMKSAAPGCVASLLAGTPNSGITVEGWVKSTSEEGGYVLSTGMGDTCSETAPPEIVRKCSIAAMWVSKSACENAMCH
jgi:hypothetical protein